MKQFRTNLLATLCLLLFSGTVSATKFLEARIVDKDYLLLHFRDGEVHYRDSGTGESAFLGHSFAEGDDTLVVFGQRLNAQRAVIVDNWTVSSNNDKSWGKKTPISVFRKSKPMNTDHTLSSELDHWLFLRLPQPMKQGCTYSIQMPSDIGLEADATNKAEVKYDIYSSPSEAVHVNIIGYSPKQPIHAADLYLWMGDGGQRDYSAFEGKRVWLYNVKTGKTKQVGKVKFWKHAAESKHEANKKNDTGSDVWTIDFACTQSGRYRLVVEDVGCSMDFDISNEVYFEPYHYSVRGYYYMRLGEKPNPNISPVPRQPAFIPEDDPVGLTVYITDLQPWHPDWRKHRGDVWDEPHFKPAKESFFWQHRLPGNPVNVKVKGGHSDAFDWDRHLAHVSNIYDLLLPYLLTNGRITEDNLNITESGNGIPDIVDEARNEVDFFLSIRDSDGGYSQGVTNPSQEWSIMFQAGSTTIAAWANAANCAMLADCFRVMGNDSLMQYYRDEAITAYEYASRQQNQQLDDSQHIGDGAMKGRDFRQMAAAYLYNVTGDTKWEKIMAEGSIVKSPQSRIWNQRNGYQIWGTAAYLICPHERHYPELYSNMKSSVCFEADENHVKPSSLRPSRRTTNDARWQTSENLQLLMLAHYVTTDRSKRQQLEHAMYIDADWCLGRNPSNTVEMTGLGQRHITDCYTTGRNDGVPGSHPGQTPFNGTETWSPGNGGDARILLNRCYPDWNAGGWPSQESFFNQRYMWVNGEFTPRETMRGKMALLGYLWGIR
ncbi:MAG: glycoside hydrolase family 9 protein [Bacteroidaceae bacterium]|nr:glycoside hydrolase family 9 protein [Bacteroidaceae bacterium]